MSWILIGCYLLAIVAANLAVGHFGPSALAVTAWVLIPFDLTVKDALQERWAGPGVVLRLGALILSGSILSAVLSASATEIAIASFLAFASAGTADSLVLAALRWEKRMVRVNASNVMGALVDSLIFQLVAFGEVDACLFVGQVAAKVVGGFAWSLLLTRTIWRYR